MASSRTEPMRWTAVRTYTFELSTGLLTLFETGAFVNQCPIIANHSFTYDFSSTTQAGTFWYHSHLAAQYCDGLRGPLVVYDLLDPHRLLYDIDDGKYYKMRNAGHF